LTLAPAHIRIKIEIESIINFGQSKKSSLNFIIECQISNLLNSNL